MNHRASESGGRYSHHGSDAGSGKSHDDRDNDQDRDDDKDSWGSRDDDEGVDDWPGGPGAPQWSMQSPGEKKNAKSPENTKSPGSQAMSAFLGSTESRAESRHPAGSFMEGTGDASRSDAAFYVGDDEDIDGSGVMTNEPLSARVTSLDASVDTFRDARAAADMVASGTLASVKLPSGRPGVHLLMLVILPLCIELCDQ